MSMFSNHNGDEYLFSLVFLKRREMSNPHLQIRLDSASRLVRVRSCPVARGRIIRI
jgi:hypothetical protein